MRTRDVKIGATYQTTVWGHVYRVVVLSQHTHTEFLCEEEDGNRQVIRTARELRLPKSRGLADEKG